MKNDNSSILTVSDVHAAIESVSSSTTDPLGQFPALQEVAARACGEVLLEMILAGTPADVARRAALRMHALSAVSALAMRRACLEGFLPEDGADLA